MDGIRLSPHETVLYQGGYESPTVGNKELMLTTKALYDITRGTFTSKVKKTDKILVDDILKDDNGAPQVFFQRPKMSYTDNFLVIYHKNGTMRLKFQNAADAIGWADKIHSAIAPDGIERIPSDDEASAGKGIFGDVARMFGSVYGFGMKKAINNRVVPKKVKKVTVHCKSCSAPITGVEGAHVKCEYCGSRQKIE